MNKLWFLVLAIELFLWRPVWALENGLARTPPMGWNSWNHFRCDVNEALIRQIADAMANNGMRAAGYQYVVIDDCWQTGRESGGKIKADPKRFSSGMAALAAYVHGRGLKFGLYTCAGTATCENRPGSYGYEEQDAATYAQWGVDFLKVDWCHAEGLSPRERYGIFRDALAKTGRPIVLAICDWGQRSPWEWGAKTGNLWRTRGDIMNCWGCENKDGQKGVLPMLDAQQGLEQYAGPGAWNDPDMMEIGNGVLTWEECKSQFSLWCILAAPLIAGNDLRAMAPQVVALLTNPEAIAVDQDTLGRQGRLVRDYGGGLQVWARPLAGSGKWAAALLNRGKAPSAIKLSWPDLGLQGKAKVRDLWARKDIGVFEGSFTAAQVPAHGVAFLRIESLESKPKL